VNLLNVRLVVGSTGHSLTMEYRSLGRTGMHVSPLCLGAMMFGPWGEPDHDTSIKIINTALDAGINFIDTADVYSQGESEIIVGKALANGRRDDVILATKFHGQMGVPVDAPVGTTGDPNRQGNSRRWIIREVENSLRRLGTDWIDLYQVHRPDADTDIEETLSALTDLQRQGKIRAFGSSTYPAQEIVEAQWTAERRGLGRFVTEQPPYSILVRGIEADVLPVAERYGMGVIPWSPLAGGWLTGRYRKGEDIPQSRRSERMPQRYDLSRPENQRKLDAADALAQLAEEAGMSLVHLAIAFVLQHPAVTAPIIGPRTMDQLQSQIGAADITLSRDVLDRIDEIVPPGTTISRVDAGYQPPSLTDPFLRRRRTA
jgi:aryl-alcohol dehydrogenase-like predicted oxidoreductase